MSPVQALRWFFVKTSRGKLRTMSCNFRVSVVSGGNELRIDSLLADIVIKK